MTSAKFEKLYKNLNKHQKIAVDAIEGPVMVVAGPGTGKTHVLTLRIANILRKTDLGPEAVLALTFTESAATAMRRRLAEIIGAAAYRVEISTFHGFCNGVIKSNPDYFPQIAGSESVDEIEQIAILEKILIKTALKELKPFGNTFYYLKEILKNIKTLKREAVRPEELAQIVKKEKADFKKIKDLRHAKGPLKGRIKAGHKTLAKNIRKTEELAGIYQEYQDRLSKIGAYDYEDMIIKVLQALSRNKDLLADLQEKFQYVLVDEHQDTNNAQNKILELIGGFHANPNIFLVGDEKQAIFRFQGASMENFNYFKKLYPKAKLIILDQSYRSNQAILDSAHSLIAGPKKLESRASHKLEKTKIFEFSSPGAEAYFLAKDIKAKISAGVPAGQIAVLYRDNKDVFAFSDTLEKENVPFVIESDENVLSDGDIGKIITLLKLIDDFGSDEKLIPVLHIDFLKLEPLEIYRLLSRAGKEKITLPEAMQSGKFKKLYLRLSRWAVLAKNSGMPELFETVTRESGFLDHLLARPDSFEKLTKLNSLFDEIKSQTDKHRDFRLKDFLNYLDTLEKHDILIKKNYELAQPIEGRLRLMTAHKSKGQEFDRVYIVNAVDGHWGNRKHGSPLTLPERVFALSGSKISPQDRNDDERRLFYVAITRARKSVSVSYSTLNTARQQLPSQFITEIDSRLIEKGDVLRFENSFDNDKTAVFKPRVFKGAALSEKKLAKELFLSKGLSVTGLNNYLECPWKYFYVNLLRIPQAMTKHQIYGTVVHGALKDFFDNFKDGKADRKLLLDRFYFHLDRQPLDRQDFRQSLIKGSKALSGYYRTYWRRWTRDVMNEFNIPGVILTPRIRLTGKLDKAEILNNKNEVNVVDYKTGKPKSRGEIEGATKNSRGDIKRQLVFYNLLLNEYGGGKYKMISGEIDFIEPDNKGRYKKEKFEIEPSEISDLKDLIKQTADEVINLKFWNKRCDDAKCQFCRLAVYE